MPNTPILSAEDVIFHANLKEFATRIGNICALEQNGKLTQSEAMDRIKSLFESLARSAENLGVGVRMDDDGPQ